MKTWIKVTESESFDLGNIREFKLDLVYGHPVIIFDRKGFFSTPLIFRFCNWGNAQKAMTLINSGITNELSLIDISHL